MQLENHLLEQKRKHEEEEKEAEELALKSSSEAFKSLLQPANTVEPAPCQKHVCHHPPSKSSNALKTELVPTHNLNTEQAPAHKPDAIFHDDQNNYPCTPSSEQGADSQSCDETAGSMHSIRTALQHDFDEDAPPDPVNNSVGKEYANVP